MALAKPLAGDADLAEARLALSRPEFNWSKALLLAGAHGVLPMLAWNVRTVDSVSGRLPATLCTELGRAFSDAGDRRARYHAALAPIFDELRSRAVPFALMKGAVLMETVYPPGTRSLNDLDLLVPAACRSIAIDTLEKNGFRPIDKVPDVNGYHELNLVNEHTSLCVDLHWNIYPRGHGDPKIRPFHFDVRDIFARARPQAFGRQRVLGTSPEDTFVHYATQLFNDDFRHTFLRVCDLYGLAAAGLDPSRLVSIAAETGAAAITHTALRVLGLLGISRPAILNRLMQISPGCGFASDFLTDPRWLFERRRIAAGAVNFILPLYVSDPHHRRRCRWLFPRHAYATERAGGRPAGAALLSTVRTMVSTLVCGGLLQVTSAGPLARSERLRTLLWRKWHSGYRSGSLPMWSSREHRQARASLDEGSIDPCQRGHRISESGR